MDVRKRAVVRIIISVYYVTAEIVNLKPFLCHSNWHICAILISIESSAHTFDLLCNCHASMVMYVKH